MASINRKQIKTISHRLRPLFLLAAMGILVLSVNGSGMPFAAAVTERMEDHGIGCGDRHWGIKNSSNEGGQADDWWFGRTTNCGVDQEYYGRSNVAVLNVGIDGSNDPIYDIAWQAVIQSTDPWQPWTPESSPSTEVDTEPWQGNNEFPLDSTLDYTLTAQWIWTNNELPENGDNIYANYLTNLWLKNGNNVVVIDFLWDRLQQDGGVWEQDTTFPDDSTAGGNQYYDPFCAPIGSYDVYHFPVVLNTEEIDEETWWEESVNIEDEIDYAFAFSGYEDDGCGSTDPGTTSSYDIVAVETGIELQVWTANHAGKVEGAYSYTSLVG